MSDPSLRPALGSGAIRASAASLALLVASAASDARAQTQARAAVAECASDRLPREILDGRAAASRAPLALVDAVAPNASLRLAVADEPASRERGLMCVLRLRPHHGMVFAFSRDSDWEFWMKNTLVSLDIVWLHADGTVATVATNVPASTRATPDAALARRRGRGRYVVELPAGEAAADGLVLGARVLLPTLSAER
ncbi:MAG: hypothetical protein NVS1B2_01680 [Vulcanimicrobiaceae bacterium]